MMSIGLRKMERSFWEKTLRKNLRKAKLYLINLRLQKLRRIVKKSAIVCIATSLLVSIDALLAMSAYVGQLA